MSDTFFFIGVIAFFFVLWYASGGPTKPISFAGPYITPITDVDTTQVGYGDTGATGDSGGGGSVWANIMNIGSLQESVAGLQRSSSEVRAFGQASPYKGPVMVSGTGGVYATDPDEEYVSIRASGDQSVDITDWKLVSGASGRDETIPQGAALPRSGRVNDTERIVLAPGDEAIITTGESPIGVSFKENMCVGYLAKKQSSFPSIQSSCPAPYDEFDRFYTGNELKDESCYQLIQSTPSCTTPKESGRLSSACKRFIDDRLTYNGCVETHRYDVQFPGRTWHIYLEHEDGNRSKELWKSSRDAVKLLDQNGLTVDLYTY